MNVTYVVVAMSGTTQAECVVTQDSELARALFELLGEIYGREHVALWNREVNRVPFILAKALAKRAYPPTGSEVRAARYYVSSARDFCLMCLAHCQAAGFPIAGC